MLWRRIVGVTGSELELTRKSNLHIFAYVRVDAAHVRVDAAHMRLQLHICLHICVLYAAIAAYMLSTPRREKTILAKKIGFRAREFFSGRLRRIALAASSVGWI